MGWGGVITSASFCRFLFWGKNRILKIKKSSNSTYFANFFQKTPTSPLIKKNKK
jgi:hypothetical protein